MNLRTLLRHLLLVAALLNFAAASALHDHDAPPLPGDGLCAICVYGGAALGGAVSSHMVQALPQWHLPPESPSYRSISTRTRAHTRIRAPPLFV